MKSTTKKVSILSLGPLIGAVSVAVGVNSPLVWVAAALIIFGSVLIVLTSIILLGVVCVLLEEWWSSWPEFRHWLERDD